MKLDSTTLINKLEPVLKDFCYNHTYLYPTTEFLNSLSIIIVDNIHNSNPKKETTGQYNWYTKYIYLYSGSSLPKLVSTLVHELAHAIQHYNLGESFRPAYTHQMNLVSYSDNIFEVQARSASDVLSLFNEEFMLSIIDSIRDTMKTYARNARAIKARGRHFRKEIMWRNTKDTSWTETQTWKAITKRHSLNTGRK